MTQILSKKEIPISASKNVTLVNKASEQSTYTCQWRTFPSIKKINLMFNQPFVKFYVYKLVKQEIKSTAKVIINNEVFYETKFLTTYSLCFATISKATGKQIPYYKLKLKF